MKMKPAKYQYKSAEDNKVSLGFIAQEMQRVVPEVVIETDSKTKYLGINYTELIPVLTKAIQELKMELDAEKAKNNKLAAELGNKQKNIQELYTMIQLMKEDVTELKAATPVNTKKVKQVGRK